MILLLGDYSSVHYELSKALSEKNVKVLLVSDGDDYKKIKCDILAPSLKSYNSKWVNRALTLFRFTGVFGVFNYLKLRKKIDKLNNIKVVQLINPVVIPSLGALGNILLVKYLRQKAEFMSLCALGDDYKWVSSCLNKKYKYSALDRLREGGIKNKFTYIYSLKYVYSPLYFFLDNYVRSKANIIVPGLLDYEIAYKNEEKLTPIIPIPISSDSFKKPEKSTYPLTVFHAWQKGKDNRKGNDVLDRIVHRYMSTNNDKIIYEVISGLTYAEYLEKYKQADIILDQIYSYDRGVTGALGLAASKVVFSGFEEGNFKIGVNSTPDEDKLFNDFSHLVDSLELVDSIKKEAFDYALACHNSDKVAEQYLKVWGVQ